MPLAAWRCKVSGMSSFAPRKNVELGEPSPVRGRSRPLNRPLTGLGSPAFSFFARGEGDNLALMINFELPLREETSMDAETALQMQIEAYRRMTGEQRLAIALGLHELSC